MPKKIFYTLKPLIPRQLQLTFRRRLINYQRQKFSHIWPIDEAAGNTPDNWQGWPNGKQFAFVLHHDVDTQRGHDNVLRLAELEMQLGFQSSFNFVPERYTLSRALIDKVQSMGFEVGVHGLKHDGKLFWSKQIFAERALKINEYLKNWGSVGFTSPSMHHNLEWMNLLHIEHATSTFDTDPFEPQPDAVGTIFPFPVYSNSGSFAASQPFDFSASQQPSSFSASQPPRFFIELPYTLPQDFTLFILMEEKTTNIWKRKLDWIAEKGGMALLNTHPDYMQFYGNKKATEMYPVALYEEFLLYITENYNGRYWRAVPREAADACKKNLGYIDKDYFKNRNIEKE